MTTVRPIELVSIDDYLAGEQASPVKHEYTGGYVYAMAGARNVHNTIAGAFFGALYAQLRGRPCRPFNSDTKVRVRLSTHTRFYYPDGMVVCEPNKADDTFQDRPIVIAEVISDATRRIDEGEKRDAYLTIPTLSAYLLIESDSPRVVAYERTEQGFVAKLYEGSDAVVPLTAIGARLALADLYERVDFSSVEPS
jgi:Uma2 family endonuclease